VGTGGINSKPEIRNSKQIQIFKFERSSKAFRAARGIAGSFCFQPVRNLLVGPVFGSCMKLNIAGLALVFGAMGIVVSFGEEAAPTEEFVSEVIAIKHENAADIAAALNSLTTRYHELGTNPLASKRGAGTAVSNAWVNASSQFKELNTRREEGGSTGRGITNTGRDRIISDKPSNSVLIYANKSDMNILKEVISKLDEAREQILIEAVIFEVDLSGPNSVDTLCFSGSGPETRSLRTNARNGNSAAFVPLGGTEADFDVMLTRMAEHKEVRILQRPRIQTSDGVAASLFVGDSRYCARMGGNEPGMAREKERHRLNELLGVTLDVSPTITVDRKLAMSIGETIEKYGGSTHIANVGDVPITTRHSLQTEVTVADRQTIVFAGQVEETQDKPSKGVPVLKNTPLIGGLFRNHPKKMKVETLLAIRATILPQEHAGASEKQPKNTGT
jgi:type II secretory pathway component GspD/PulD (secretin)